MSLSRRINILKKAVSRILMAMTHRDYISVVTFNHAAETFLNLSTLAQTTPEFRQRLISYINDLESTGRNITIFDFHTLL